MKVTSIFKAISLIAVINLLIPVAGNAGYCWRKVKHYQCFKDSPQALDECDAACKKFYPSKKNVRANSIEKNSKSCAAPFDENPTSDMTACYCDYCR